jgi:hypothetical protein
LGCVVSISASSRGPDARHDACGQHRGAPALALERCGQHTVQRLAPGAGVFFGHPARQLEQPAFEQRLVVEHAQDALQLAIGRRGRRGHRDHDPHFAQAAERHDDAHARHGALRELGLHRVGELRAHRPIDRDLDQRCRGGLERRAVFLGGCGRPGTQVRLAPKERRRRDCGLALPARHASAPQ